jgi:hypothetical protein
MHEERPLQSVWQGQIDVPWLCEKVSITEVAFFVTVLPESSYQDPAWEAMRLAPTLGILLPFPRPLKQWLNRSRVPVSNKCCFCDWAVKVGGGPKDNNGLGFQKDVSMV